MPEITLGQISTAIVFITGLWVAIETIVKKINSLFDEKLKPLTDKIDRVDKNATMNYLVRCISDLDRHEKLEGAYRKRFIEQYEHYVNDLKGNSYIKEEVERLKRESKL